MTAPTPPTTTVGLSGATMQSATVRCPPNVFRDRYSLSDFEVARVYAEGPNWSISSARCRWSEAQVVLQTYTEVGNVSGCMAAAMATAHGLSHHPALLPLYAVFRDSSAAAAAAGSSAGGGGGGGGPGRSDRVIMVYPGGGEQRPLDALGALPSSQPSSQPSGATPSSSAATAASGGGTGPPVSERGVVRGLLQPLSDLVLLLVSAGLRPPYLCGLDVWLGSPEAKAPGQALFMVPLMCHRRGRGPPSDLSCLPVALPYIAPYLRAHPEAACDQEGQDEGLMRRCLAWSAAALVHTTLMGSAPADKAALRRMRKGGTTAHAAAAMQLSLPSPSTPSSAATASPAAAAAFSSSSALPLQLPPLGSPPGGTGYIPRGSNVGGSMLHSIGIQRPGVGPGGAGSGFGTSPTSSMQRRTSANGVNGGTATLASAYDTVPYGGGTGSLLHGGTGSSGMITPGSSAGIGTPGGSSRHSRTSASMINGGSSGSGSGSGSSHALGVVPLWLSDEAGDWFRRGLALEDGGRATLEDMMKHHWVARHAVGGSAASRGQDQKRESLNGVSRDMYPMMLDVVPLGVSRPGREEVENMMAEMAAAEGPSVAKPAMPWELHEGPQEPAPLPSPAGVDAAAAAMAEAGGGDGGVIERYEVAEEQKDGWRVVEETRVVGSKEGGALGRAAQALQAAHRMGAAGRGRGGEGAASGGGGGGSTWIAAHAKGATFDDIARMATHLHRAGPAPALPPPVPRGGRRLTDTSPGRPARPSGSATELPPASGASPTRTLPPAAAAAPPAAAAGEQRRSSSGTGASPSLPVVAEARASRSLGPRSRMSGTGRLPGAKAGGK